LSSRLATQGHDWVRRHFTSDAMAENYLRMYESVLGITRNRFTDEATRNMARVANL
jgi:hypothetical protein